MSSPHLVSAGISNTLQRFTLDSQTRSRLAAWSYWRAGGMAPGRPPGLRAVDRVSASIEDAPVDANSGIFRTRRALVEVAVSITAGNQAARLQHLGTESAERPASRTSPIGFVPPQVEPCISKTAAFPLNGTWRYEHRPLTVCGPYGSGTMNRLGNRDRARSSPDRSPACGRRTSQPAPQPMRFHPLAPAAPRGGRQPRAQPPPRGPRSNSGALSSGKALVWPKPVVRPIRFHDLRHTTATLLLCSGVPLVVVQKVLRHRDPKLTETVYGHLATDYLRAEVNRLKLQGMPEAPRLRAVDAGRVPPVSPTFRKTPKGPERRGRNPSDSDPFSVSGRQDSNLRPLGPEGPSRISRESPDVQVLANSQAPGAAADAVAPVGRPRTLPHVTPVLPTSGRRSPRLSALDAPLLSVRETAERLRVSTATIYALCGRGELRHVRVSNAIRLRVEDLEDFIRRGGR